MTDQATGRSLTYQSGDWYGVVGPHVVVLLPPEEKARVAGIWTLADAGAGFDETLDALIADGLRALHGFVLVSSSEGDTKVVIRGEARASFLAAGERVEVEGLAATTWVERSLAEVSAMEVVVGDAPEGTPSYAMDLGLVRVARLTEGTFPDETPAPVEEPAVADEPGLDTDHEAPDTDGGAGLALVGGAGPAGLADVAAVPPAAPPFGDDLPATEETAEPEVEPDLEPVEPDDGAPTDIFSVVPAAPEPVAEVDVDPWIDPSGESAPLEEPSFESAFDITPTAAPDVAAIPEPIDATGAGVWSPTPVEPADPVAFSSAEPEADVEADLPDEPSSYDLDGADGADVEDDDDLFDGDDVETGVFAPVVPEPVEPVPPVPPVDDGSPSDHDGLTHLSPFDQDEIELVRPGIPGQEPAPAVTARPVARLVVSTGETIDVDRVVILGRAPSARSLPDGEQPVLVRLPSPHQEISSTHVEVRPGSGADHGTAVVTDLGSTNGTIVVQPGIEAEELQPGVSVQLIPGAIIDLGDGITIQVVRP